MDFLKAISENNKKVSDLMNEISAYVKRERKKRNLNQTELGNLIGVSRDTISKIESGNDNYNAITFFKIVKYFGNMEALVEVFLKKEDSLELTSLYALDQTRKTKS